MHITNCKKIVPIACLAVLSLLPAHALSLLEGRVSGGIKHTGSYDLLLQVWGKTDNTSTAKLLQTIQIPKVYVVDGGFKIPLDASLESRLDFELIYKVQSRPFEAWEPFQPAEVSRISQQSVTPGLVMR